MSHPTRMRGLKSDLSGGDLAAQNRVASHADAWIEINRANGNSTDDGVASHADAWIEIPTFGIILHTAFVASHADAWIEIPIIRSSTTSAGSVASHADAWIEMSCTILRPPKWRSRIPRGCVD